MSAPELRIDPGRVISDLKELRSLTADEDGAQRVAWSDTWVKAREWFDGKLADLDVEVEVDEAGNKWVTLPGADPHPFIMAGHIDSVPNGGWLDGSLGLLAGLEVMRGAAAAGPLPISLQLVDWADEEGARFGYGMLGSSAVSGSLDVDRVRKLSDREGNELPAVLAARGVDVDRMLEARGRLDGARGYVELHIEQGPVLEDMGLPLAVVNGTVGVERHVVRFTGQAAHAGPTPMDRRRDSLGAAARLLLAMREDAVDAGSKFTAGRLVTKPGVATVVADEVELTVDQRHAEGTVLADLLARAKTESAAISAEEKVNCEWSRLWSIEPMAFDPSLIEIATEVVTELAGEAPAMDSGALHDAGEVVRAGVPTVMLFVQSLGGISHVKVEDTREEHLALSVEALAKLVERVLDRAG